jgi:hypothetical protein
MADIASITSNFITIKKEIFPSQEIPNTFDVEVGSDYTDSELSQLEIFNKLLESEITDETQLKELYLNCYQQIIKTFIRSGSESMFLRNKTIETNFNGLDIIKSINFLDFLDIQQLKDKVYNSLSNDPCILLDSSPKTSIHPLRQQMLKANFMALCRLHVTYLKLSNLFISSVFDNNEMVKNDSTFITFAYDTFKQKVSSIIPSYYTSIKVFLYDELNDLLQSGTEFVDPLTNETYQFTFPLDDNNLEINVDKYLKYLFNQEHSFVLGKFNTTFQQAIKDADEVTNFPLYPTTNSAQTLYNVRDYFFDNLFYFTLNAEQTFLDLAEIISNINITSTTLLFKLLISDSPEIEDIKLRTYTLSINIVKRFMGLPSELIELPSFNVSTAKTINASLEYPQQDSDEVTQILQELKAQFLSSNNVDVLLNYVFPLNKILNIASLFYTQSNMKLYEPLSIAVDGSIKTIDTVHNMILGNDNKIECEQPSDPLSLDNPILGINLEIAKMIASAPIQILKGLEETFDPNIAIASKLRDLSVAAGAPNTPVALWSLALLPFLTIPPPYGVGPPLISPWGYIYWGVDAGEVLTSYAKNGFGSDTKIDLKSKISVSVNPFKNKNC